MDQRVFAVRRFRDGKLAVLDRKPGPAGAELRGAGGNEISLELVVTAEIAESIAFGSLPGSLVPPPPFFIQCQKWMWL